MRAFTIPLLTMTMSMNYLYRLFFFFVRPFGDVVNSFCDCWGIDRPVYYVFTTSLVLCRTGILKQLEIQDCVSKFSIDFELY